MHAHRLFVFAFILSPALLIAAPLPVHAQQSTVIAQAAQPTPAEVKAAVKNALMSVDLTLRQKREIKSMTESYQTQTANADDATKKADAKALLKNIYGVLTPDQQTKFKASIKQSLAVDIQ